MLIHFLYLSGEPGDFVSGSVLRAFFGNFGIYAALQSAGEA